MNEPIDPNGPKDPNDPDDMLFLARSGLADWRKARDKTAAERHAARLIAYAFGRLDVLASDGQLPGAWTGDHEKIRS